MEAFDLNALCFDIITSPKQVSGERHQEHPLVMGTLPRDRQYTASRQHKRATIITSTSGICDDGRQKYRVQGASISPRPSPIRAMNRQSIHDILWASSALRPPEDPLACLQKIVDAGVGLHSKHRMFYVWKVYIATRGLSLITCASRPDVYAEGAPCVCSGMHVPLCNFFVQPCHLCNNIHIPTHAAQPHQFHYN